MVTSRCIAFHASARGSAAPLLPRGEELLVNQNRKQNLTDRTLKTLKPAKSGARYEIIDTTQPGLAIRVTSGGAKTFVLRSRFPSSKHFTRRALGAYPTLSLHEARDKARDWLRLISKGIDPEIEAERARQEELRKQDDKFAAVAAEYILKKVIGPKPEDPKHRRWRETKRDIDNFLVARWGKRSIHEIDRVEIKAFLLERQKTPAMARNLLVKLSSLFAWAVETESYGLESSPCTGINFNTLIGEAKARDRSLSDQEIKAFWRATGKLDYPSRDLFRLLLLSGLRLNELAKATWSEVDFSKREILIPKERMKGRKDKARPHLLPLTSDMIEILENLPRFDGGDFIFSNKSGAMPMAVTDKVKARLDAAMLAELRKGSKHPEKVKLVHFVTHDLRRVVRSKMSELNVPHEVAEQVLAHVRPGISGVYDVHDYLAEKRGALKQWNDELRGMVKPEPEPEPKADNVFKLRAAR
jgi:integrase